MAHKLVAASLLIVSTVSATTCPGFPGYCSESFPGQTCNVVCSFGRNNVPLCQEDGSWTDIPRCIEHEPGVEEQIPGLCPGISGYCSQGFLNHECKFDCATGPDINSVCSADGTWQPYPTCQGDLRDTRDGCDGCPGPLGGKRNRTAEAILGVNPATNNRVPKIGSVQGGSSSTRKNVPSFAGNIKFGALQPKPATTNTNNRRARPEDNFVVDSQGRIQARQPAAARLPAQVAPVARQPVQVARQPAPVPPQPVRPQPQQQQQRFPTFQQQQQQQQFVNLQQQQQQRNFRPQQPQQPLGGFQQQNAFQQPQQRPSSFQQQPPQALTGGLFDQIKSRIQQGNRQRAQQQQQQQQQQQLQPQAAVPAAPQSAARAPAQPAGPTFGPFRAVDFGNALAREEQPSLVGPSRPNLSRRPSNDDNFFGEFATVNL